MTVVGESEKRPEEVSSNDVSKVEQEPKKPETVFDNMSEKSAVPVESATDETLAQSELPGTASSNKDIRTKIHREEFSSDELVITPAEKAAFVESMITGERYRQECSIFGDRIRIVIRSRTTPETQALYAFMRHSLKSGDAGLAVLEGDMSYILLVAQIEELNGTKFPEMKAPLTYVEDGSGEKEPGWLMDLKAWKTKPEGLVNALINRVQLFEYKYWTMVSEASNKNFWNPDTSSEA